MKSTHTEHSQLFTPDNLMNPISMETSGMVKIKGVLKIPLY